MTFEVLRIREPTKVTHFDKLLLSVLKKTSTRVHDDLQGRGGGGVRVSARRPLRRVVQGRQGNPI